jgi:hypothetical protein
VDWDSPNCTQAVRDAQIDVSGRFGRSLEIKHYDANMLVVRPRLNRNAHPSQVLQLSKRTAFQGALRGLYLLDRMVDSTLNSPKMYLTGQIKVFVELARAHLNRDQGPLERE